MTVEMLFLFLAGSLEFYGAWSIDFAWRGRETTGQVGLPFPGRMVHVSARSWWRHAWLAMSVGVAIVVVWVSPFDGFIGIGSTLLVSLGLIVIWFAWYRGKGIFGWGYAATWNVAFFLGVVGGTVLMILGA